jgi:CheY-like chemotaxis protein
MVLKNAPDLIILDLAVPVMDGFTMLREGRGDNPTIGLILCAEKSAAVARYSIVDPVRFRIRILWTWLVARRIYLDTWV